MRESAQGGWSSPRAASTGRALAALTAKVREAYRIIGASPVPVKVANGDLLGALDTAATLMAESATSSGDITADLEADGVPMREAVQTKDMRRSSARRSGEYRLPAPESEGLIDLFAPDATPAPGPDGLYDLSQDGIPMKGAA
jgi:hypothetical protein